MKPIICMRSIWDMNGAHFEAEDVERPNEKTMMGVCSRMASRMMIHKVQVRMRPSLMTRPNLLHKTIEKPVVLRTQPIFAKAVLPKSAAVEPPSAMPGTNNFRMNAIACIPIPTVVARMEK